MKTLMEVNLLENNGMKRSCCETKEAAETVETESQIEPETEKAADEETVVEAAEPSVEAADAELEDVKKKHR